MTKKISILGSILLVMVCTAANRSPEQMMREARKAVDKQIVVPLNLHLAGGRDMRFSRIGPTRMFQAEFANKQPSPYIEFKVTFFDRTKKQKAGASMMFEEIAKGTYDPSSGTINILTETGLIPVKVFLAQQKAKFQPDQPFRILKPKAAG